MTITLPVTCFQPQGLGCRTVSLYQQTLLGSKLSKRALGTATIKTARLALSKRTTPVRPPKQWQDPILEEHYNLHQEKLKQAEAEVEAHKFKGILPQEISENPPPGKYKDQRDHLKSIIEHHKLQQGLLVEANNHLEHGQKDKFKDTARDYQKAGIAHHEKMLASGYYHLDEHKDYNHGMIARYGEVI